jgi:hypothetical protein
VDSRSKLFHAIVLVGSSLAASCNRAPLPAPEIDMATTVDLALPDATPVVCPLCADAGSPCCCTPDCETCYPCYI